MALRRWQTAIPLKARVRAAPEDGAANAALVKMLARSLGVAARDVELASGATSRVKRLKVSGDTASLVAALETKFGMKAGV